MVATLRCLNAGWTSNVSGIHSISNFVDKCIESKRQDKSTYKSAFTEEQLLSIKDNVKNTALNAQARAKLMPEKPKRRRKPPTPPQDEAPCVDPDEEVWPSLWPEHRPPKLVGVAAELFGDTK